MCKLIYSKGNTQTHTDKKPQQQEKKTEFAQKWETSDKGGASDKQVENKN